MNTYISKVIIILNNDATSIINNQLSSCDKVIRVGDFCYKLQKQPEITSAPATCQPQIQNKAVITFDVEGSTPFDAENFLKNLNVHYNQFNVYVEDESSMGKVTIWVNNPEKQINQWFDESYDEVCGPVDFIKIKDATDWHKPSVAETLLLYPMTNIV